MSVARPFLRSSWTWLGAGLLLVGLISLIGAGSGSSPPALDAGSARPDGALALRLWLERIGYRVEVSGNRPDVSGAAPNGTIALLAAGSDVPAGDIPGLFTWVRSGGHLLVASDGGAGATLLDRLGVGIFGVSGPAQAVHVEQPLLLSPPVATLDASATAVLQGTSSDVEVVAARDGTVLLLRRLGLGTIWLLSAPSVLDNAHLAAADNRRLALNLAGPKGASILFDQYRPPAAASNGNWLTSTAWGVALLFLIAVLVLYRWLAGWRLGPPVTPLRLQYRPATEYVVSLAGLLRRARRREDVLEIYQTSLRRLIRRRYGDLDAASIDRSRREELETLLRPADSLSENELMRRAAAVVEEEERVVSRES